MFITADQLLCHAIGDYVLQSHWVATEKTRNSTIALLHVITYGLPFLFLRPSWPALAVIVSTHFVIDRWRLAKYLVWVKNFLSPKHYCLMPPDGMTFLNQEQVTARWRRNFRWSECDANGFPPETPIWLSTWLLIIVDNLCHIVLNGLALKYL